MLDKSVGKKFLVDENPETCWTSQQVRDGIGLCVNKVFMNFLNPQGLPQYIHLAFSERVIPKRISFTFQGGFVGTQCSVYISSEVGNGWNCLCTIYPEDVNRRQSFELGPSVDTTQTGVSAVKLVFEQSSDFFGRITVYDLKLEGAIDR